MNWWFGALLYSAAFGFVEARAEPPPAFDKAVELRPSFDWGEARTFDVNVYRNNYYYVGVAPADPVNLLAYSFRMVCETVADGKGRAVSCSVPKCHVGKRRASMEYPLMKACSWGEAVGIIGIDDSGRASSFRIEGASATDGAHDVLRSAMGVFDLEFSEKPTSWYREWRQKGSPMLMQQWGQWGAGSYRMKHSVRPACEGGSINRPKVPATVGCPFDAKLVQIDSTGRGVQTDLVAGSVRVESEFSGAAIFDPELGMVVMREAVTNSSPSKSHLKGPLDTGVEMFYVPVVP
jgi:hypothetical protein